MPEISRFFGIVIRMFAEFQSRHSRPHFHAYYQGVNISVSIHSHIEILAGTLPKKAGATRTGMGRITSTRIDGQLVTFAERRTASNYRPTEINAMEYTDIKIKSVRVVNPYILELTFNDGSLKTVNLESILHGALFGPLQNPELFGQVRLNSEIETIEWPNGADFHPETLYRWERYKEELAAIAAKWQHARKAG